MAIRAQQLLSAVSARCIDGKVVPLPVRGTHLFAVAILWLLTAAPARAQLHVEDQHSITRHREEDLIGAVRTAGPAPITVSTTAGEAQERYLPLDEAILIALQNSEVIRVLGGVSASSSGRTVYDVARATTTIDQAVARFDPVFSANSTWRKTESPVSMLHPFDPLRALIAGSQIGGNDISAQVSQTNRHGGVGAIRVETREWIPAIAV